MDRAVAVGPQRQRRQTNGLELGAEPAQHLLRFLDAAHLLGVGGGVLPIEMLDHADAQPFQPALQVGQAIGGRPRRAGRIVRVMAGDGVKQDGVVLDIAGHRPNVVERMGQREHAGEADRAVGRLQADDAAAGGRVAHRAAGVGAERRRYKSSGQRRARAARRAAGVQVAVPGIARRRPGQVERRPAGRELVQRELAEQNSAGLAQLADHEGVGVGAMIYADLGMAGGRQTRDIENILGAVGHAVHRPAPLTLGDLGLGLLGLRQRGVRRHHQERVVMRIERGDAVKQRARPFHRRQLLCAQQFGALGDAEPGDVGHWSCSKQVGSNTGAGAAIGEMPL